jgi:hypothetical protein
MVVQDLGKEARDKGEKGPILGNAKIRSTGAAPSAPAAKKPAPQENPDEDCPF